MFVLVFYLSSYSLDIIGVSEEKLKKYASLINEEKETFTCFDGKKTIPLSKLNDNYCDCNDCSDEPGTGVGPQNETFTCKNSGFIPIEIPRWSVGDGICDCCDGSDEMFNSHIKCQDTCSQFEKLRLKVFRKFEKPIKSGQKEYSKLVSESSKFKQNYLNQIESLKIALQNKPLFSETANLSNVDIPAENSINPTIEISTQNATLYTEKYHLEWFKQHCNPGAAQAPNETEISNCESIILSNITSLQNILKMDNATSSYIPMYNKEFSNGIYKLQLMNELKQGKITVGKFTKFENDSMYFDGGDYCDVVKANRTAKIKLICWKDNKLLEFKEPNICYYESIFATPAACTDGNINYLKRLGVEELENLEKKLK
ncbi:Glucosidase 2 subunit beta [Histomonas meleagridis]|uniref:Glucosidase 2 subunit beta n=1 Tax=Histomonas meleagridis TaxID=135588 RepID=UPI00355A185B|nr:Glucosidase 2 subunit beta [Histomonas meleagridis]KAH0801581.1 Glucosidase 2 subunit beta [Histomonas meleagridis]